MPYATLDDLIERASEAAIRQIAADEVPTTFVRISDGNETGFSLATQKAATTLKKKLEG